MDRYITSIARIRNTDAPIQLLSITGGIKERSCIKFDLKKYLNGLQRPYSMKY